MCQVPAPLCQQWPRNCSLIKVVLPLAFFASNSILQTKTVAGWPANKHFRLGLYCAGNFEKQKTLLNYLQVLEPLLLRVMEAVHEGREFPMLMSLHLSILSRLILASHSLFAALCLTSATRIGSNHNDVAGKVRINLKIFLTTKPTQLELTSYRG